MISQILNLKTDHWHEIYQLFSQLQVENAKRKNDSSKVISLETELAAVRTYNISTLDLCCENYDCPSFFSPQQTTLSEQLRVTVESQAQKLELYKVQLPLNIFFL